MIPQNPVMMLSYVNTKLRDEYASLESLCDDLDLDQEEIIQKLASVDCHYDKELNQFK